MRPNLENSIINSALWAAVADSLGWITELVDRNGVIRRIGKPVVSCTVPWKRKIGGITGVTVELPAGTYSDDTQLRLAICRSIQADGYFDVEAFAKVELPTWASYALGAGRGTKVAASNIAKRDVNWFSNFYSQGDQLYFQGGGNGAAMRVQPHIWRRARGSRDYLVDVLKDAVVTHGHMRGVCGAVFHADCLSYTMETGEIPGPSEWLNFVNAFDDIVPAIKSDLQLGKFWLGPWEQGSGMSLSSAVKTVAEEMRQYIPLLGDYRVSVERSYSQALEALDCFNSRKGTGTNTALAAAYLAWVGQDQDIEKTILIAVNALGSDTDTIGTMVGALLGSISMTPPPWEVQDEVYIRMQAIRMACIAESLPCDGFQYPDLFTWQPPSNQSNALVLDGSGYYLKGLGRLESLGKCWNSGLFTWEWFSTPFGQTVLCKRKLELKVTSKVPRDEFFAQKNLIDYDEVRVGREAKVHLYRDAPEVTDLELPLFKDQYLHDSLADYEKISKVERNNQGVKADLKYNQEEIVSAVELDRGLAELTDLVIKSNFDSSVLGSCFLECLAGSGSIEKVVAFSAIIAKAIDVRQKKGAK